MLTKAIETKLAKFPFRSQEKNPTPEIIVKFFQPWGAWTWYATEGQKNEEGKWEFFGLVEGFEKEWGYFNLEELQSVRGPAGLKIERDMYFEGKHLDAVTNKVF